MMRLEFFQRKKSMNDDGVPCTVVHTMKLIGCLTRWFPDGTLEVLARELAQASATSTHVPWYIDKDSKVTTSTLSNRKVKRTENKLGSAGARLSNTAKGQAEFKHLPPTRKVTEVTTYEGLFAGNVTEEQAQASRDKARAWLAEFNEVRAEREDAALAKQVKDTAHRKEAQRSSADYDSGLRGVITPSRVARTHVASSDIVSWFSE